MPESILDKDTAKLGFVGLGLMGSRLARRLHSSGWKIQVWNRSPEATKPLATEGITIAPSLFNLASNSDVILSCLANDGAVRAVYFEKDGIFSHVKPGTTILEMSTISPELSSQLHQEAAVRSVHLLDSAISGSTPAVEAGTITLLVGGDQRTFDRCIPVFESLAKQWFLIGPASSGILMKLVVNLLLGLDMQAIAEAVSLGEHLHIDRNILLDVLSKTAVIPPAMMGKFQKIKDHDYSPQFPLRLLSKDIDLVMDAARKSGTDLPATKVVQAVLTSALPSSGDLDMSAITPVVLNHKKG